MKTVADYRKRIGSLRDGIKHLEEVALEGVAFVGAANYQHRQEEAEERIRAAAELALSK